MESVPTNENPADIGSRGCPASKIPELWFQGPKWLPYKDQWPVQPKIQVTYETEQEAKIIKELMSTTLQKNDTFDKLMSKFDLWKCIKVIAWINRFITNCKKEKINGPLTTSEIKQQRTWFIKREQQKVADTDKFKADQQYLNLQENEVGLYVCKGRIQGDFPIYLPSTSILSQKIIQECHKPTIHGGVTTTMAKVRDTFWMPKLRQITKRVLTTCHGCKRFYATPYHDPKPGVLPNDRTKENLPYEVIETDYAGPIYCKIKTKQTKTYALLFTCSITLAVHLELLSNQTTLEFIKAFKKLIARRGSPNIVYSDNAKTYVAAAKWI